MARRAPLHQRLGRCGGSFLLRFWALGRPRGARRSRLRPCRCAALRNPMGRAVAVVATLVLAVGAGRAGRSVAHASDAELPDLPEQRRLALEHPELAGPSPRVAPGSPTWVARRDCCTLTSAAPTDTSSRSRATPRRPRDCSSTMRARATMSRSRSPRARPSSRFGRARVHPQQGDLPALRAPRGVVERRPPDGGIGRVFDLKRHHLRPAGLTSVDAAGLPIWPGVLRYNEVASGVVDQAIRFTAQRTDRAYVWPTRHQAGAARDASLPPMGALSPTEQPQLRRVRRADPGRAQGDAALPPDSSPPTDRTGFSRARCRAAGPISSSPS
jgi:hypothetical protein